MNIYLSNDFFTRENVSTFTFYILAIIDGGGRPTEQLTELLAILFPWFGLAQLA